MTPYLLLHSPKPFTNIPTAKNVFNWKEGNQSSCLAHYAVSQDN